MIASYSSSLGSLSPISVSAGPTSCPIAPTLWQRAQAAVSRRNTLAPFATLPLRLTNSATGGNGLALAPGGRGNTLAASALMSGQRTVLKAKPAVNFAFCGSFPSLAHAKICRAPVSKLASPFKASLRTLACTLGWITSGVSSGSTF